jgi:hypothetical protein
MALHQGLDHLNSPKVPHNGYKGATKDTKPKWKQGVQKWIMDYILKLIYLENFVKVTW